MVGLERVTGKIIAEAEADAARIAADAAEKCAAADAQTDAAIAALKSRVAAEIDAEGENIILRAKSASATSRRNIILAAKGKAVDDAFGTALCKLSEMPRETYINLLSSLVRRAVREYRQYGTENGAERQGALDCTLTFNRRDRDEVASNVTDLLSGDACPDVTFNVSDKAAPISGGVLLDFGPVDVDCSIDVILTQMRPGLEGEVCRILFAGEART